MNILSPNTQAILLLTAPLIFGRATNDVQLLSAGEYGRLARRLHEMDRQPGDLLGDDAQSILASCVNVLDPGRAEKLLARGVALSLALERWTARNIWVISRSDEAYPRRLRDHMKDGRPPVLYGCGDITLLDHGGLAVVGSRDVADEGLQYAESVGRLCAGAGLSVVSGGARGVDAMSMLGALQAGGRALGVLADSLEAQALSAVWREALQEGRLLLVSPYDPRTSFHTGNAMGRNKLIYALSDFALVVASDLKKGGTWNGAVEQLDRLKFVSVYVRSDEHSPGLMALRQHGALVWPEPADSAALRLLQGHRAEPERERVAAENAAPIETSPPTNDRQPTQGTLFGEPEVGYGQPAPDELWMTARRVLLHVLRTPKKELDIAVQLGVEKSQARAWLNKLAAEGAAIKRKTMWCVSSAQ